MSRLKRSFEALGIPARPTPDDKRAKPSNSQPNPADMSWSNEYPNLLVTLTPSNVTHDQPGTHARGKETTGQAILSTLKGSMKLLRKGGEIFPPLGDAAETLLKALEAIESTTQDVPDAHEMISDLPQWASILSGYLSDSQPSRMTDRVQHLIGVLVNKAEFILSQQRGGKLRRLQASEQEAEQLRLCYFQIEAAFHQLQCDASLSTWRNSDKQVKDLLLSGMSPAHDARYDSSYSDDVIRGGCYQNTRVNVLDGIRGWISHQGQTKIYWMNGMAGTGKTTIAYSVCTELEKNGGLAASFFCSRSSPECRDVKRMLPTIAYQLAQRSYSFRSVLCRILSEEANIGQRNVAVQFEHLIKVPLLDVGDLLPRGLVIVIDALDECSDPRTTQMLLDTLFLHASNLPIRFFITSRPEPTILNTLQHRDSKMRSVLHLHNVDHQSVKADIETYLTVALARLLPTISQIKRLADQAGILFIYPATVVRYILATGRVNPHTRLANVLDKGASGRNKKDKEIDQLYRVILDVVLDDGILEECEVTSIKQLLWTVVCVREPVTIKVLTELLGLNHQDVKALLQSLLSVLHITDESEVVSTLHASFADFMLSPERSGLISCDEAIHNAYLTNRCFEVMKNQLAFNICALETSYRLDVDIPDFKARVDARISPELFYSCRYWAEHMRRSRFCQTIVSNLDAFLREQLLSCIEVLNLKGWIGNGPAVLADAQNWLADGECLASETRKFVRDARNFATMFAANPIRQSTPHLYLSLLPLVPRQSKVWGGYRERMRGLLRVDGTMMGQREALLVTWEVEAAVSTAIYSIDGSQVVYGCVDGTICVWDAQNGTSLVGPFKGHTESVQSIALSPDGTRIVSGSWDRTIRIWDTSAGIPITDPLKGHTNGVNSVAFSPDGTWVVSGSADRTIRVWNTHDGSLLPPSPFKGHAQGVNSVAFSPNRVHVVSGSWDRTVRLWDIASGNLVLEPFRGHTNSVNSVVFSPDGSRIASGSSDRTILVWDAENGNLIAGPFKGHINGVNSVVFSPDGTRLASGSWDFTLRVWHSDDGKLLAGPFKGHTNTINAVTFSPDGTRILSGSADRTIRLWDGHDEIQLAKNQGGHTNTINSIAFSSNGTRIVSGSADRTIQIWDAITGARILSPLKGHTDSVESVAISPDDSCIASGSADCTVRLWHTDTGIPLAPPGRRHTRSVKCISFSHNGAWMVSGSLDSTAFVWDTHDGTVLAGPFSGRSGIGSASFSPDSAFIVLGFADGSLQMCHALDSTIPAQRFAGHVLAVNSVTFSRDGSCIASGSSDRTIRIWNVQKGTLIITLPTGRTVHTKAINSVTFSPDGARIISSSRDGVIQVWDTFTGKLSAGPFMSHTSGINALAVSPRGTHMVTCGGTIIQVWEAPSGEYQNEITGKGNTSTSGWVLGPGSRPIVWLPADLRDIFPQPPNTLVIHPEGTIRTSWADLSIGESWHRCNTSLRAAR
ncbi:hypothetical protein RSAG8_07904, partial [Rhizoctonia solani AG-8 WAC10335]